MEKQPEKLDLSYPRELRIFKEFLERRKKGIQDDFEQISKRFNITKEKLSEIKNEIRKILGGEDIEYLSTTIHLRPRAIDYLYLGLNRINQAIEDSSKVFHYPVYYQDFEKERPDLVYFGNYNFSLCEIIPNFKEKRKEKFKTSLDFHNALIEYLQSENWQEEIRLNLETFIEKEFSNYKKNLRGLLFDNIYDVIVSLLVDYKNFFETNEILQTPSEIFEKNKKLAEVLLENFEILHPILQGVSITKEYLEDIKEQRITRITSEFIFAICVLGNLVHVGAEYGKFNELRKVLGLNTLEEPPEESPQERFRFFELTSEKRAENDTLRFLLGINSKDIFVQVAKYEGLEERQWSPVSEEIRKRIRIFDFYLKLKEYFSEILGSFETVYLSKDQFVELLKSINYFTHLNNYELSRVNEVFEKLPINRKNNLKEWSEIYNNNLEQVVKEKKEIKPERLRIILDILRKKILAFIFKHYIQGDFESMKNALPNEFIQYFLEEEKIELMKTFKTESQEKGFLFYGLQLPLEVENFNKDDIINFVRLLKIVDENFNEKIVNSFSPY